MSWERLRWTANSCPLQNVACATRAALMSSTWSRTEEVSKFRPTQVTWLGNPITFSFLSNKECQSGMFSWMRGRLAASQHISRRLLQEMRSYFDWVGGSSSRYGENSIPIWPCTKWALTVTEVVLQEECVSYVTSWMQLEVGQVIKSIPPLLLDWRIGVWLNGTTPSTCSAACFSGVFGKKMHKLHNLHNFFL